MLSLTPRLITTSSVKSSTLSVTTTTTRSFPATACPAIILRQPLGATKLYDQLPPSLPLVPIWDNNGMETGIGAHAIDTNINPCVKSTARQWMKCVDKHPRKPVKNNLLGAILAIGALGLSYYLKEKYLPEKQLNEKKLAEEQRLAVLKQTPLSFYEWVYLDPSDPRFAKGLIKFKLEGKVKDLVNQYSPRQDDGDGGFADELITEFERFPLECEGFVARSTRPVFDSQFMDAWVANCNRAAKETGMINTKFVDRSFWEVIYNWWNAKRLIGQMKHYLQAKDDDFCRDLIKFFKPMTDYPGKLKTGSTSRPSILLRAFYDASKELNVGLGGSNKRAHTDTQNLTIILYNNTVDSKYGGATVFPNADLKFQPIKGHVLIFATASLEHLKNCNTPYKTPTPASWHYGQALEKGTTKDLTILASNEC